MQSTYALHGSHVCLFNSSLRSGRLLLSNMLIDLLASAEAFLSDTTAEAVETGSNGRPRLPLHPLSPVSETVYKAHCLQPAALGNTSTNSGNDNTNSSGGAAGSGLAHSPGHPDLPDQPDVMTVVKADGWTFVEVDGEAKKYKPGLLATSPGSVLQFELPLMRALPASVASTPSAGNLTFNVHLTYLASYR